MSVTEKLMGDGRFDIRINVNSTPTSVLNKLTAWSHIVLTPQPVSPDEYNDNTILANARYTGVILRKETDGDTMTVVGRGLGTWLGDKDNRGRMINTPTRSFNNVSINTALDSNTTPYGILRDDSGATGGVIKGTITETGTNFTGRFIYTNAKSALEQICVQTGAEYRINPDGEIDVGSQSALFTTTPTTVVVRNQGGDDPNITGVQISQLKSEFNAEDYVSEVRLLGEDAGFSVTEGVATQSSIPYKDLFGNTMKRTALISEANIPDNQKDARATASLDEFNRTKQTIRLITEIYDVNGEYNTGDSIFVYDPDIDFVDETNSVEYRGQIINPVSIRVLGITFPVSAGMGIYHRDKDGNYEALGGFVQYDTGEATIEVGESPKSLIDDLKFSGVRIQDKYADLGSVPDTPTSVAGSTATYLNNEGITEGAVDVTWNQPNNTDGTTIVDGYQYRIRYKPTTASGYQYVATDFSDRAVTLYSLITGTSYHIGVAAVDTKGYESTYSSNITVAIPADSTAPSQPKQADAIATSALRVMITHSLGKQGDLNNYTLEKDIERLNVYGSTTSGFTVNTDSKIGEIPVTFANISSQIPVQGVIPLDSTDVNYFKFTAVDRSGNESVPSTQQSATATLIDSQHIASAAIATAHIGNAQITTAKIGDAQITNAKINSLSADKLTAGTIDASSITVTNLSASNITGGTLNADRINAGSLDFNKISSSSINIIRDMIANDAINQDKIADNAVDTAQLINDAVTDAILASNAVYQNAIQNNAINSDKIANGAIIEAKLADGSVTNAKIGNLDASKITTGTLLAGVINTTSLASVFINTSANITSALTVQGQTVKATGNVQTGDRLELVNATNSFIDIGSSSIFSLRPNGGSTGLQLGSSSSSYINTNWLPTSNNSKNIGSSFTRWAEVFAVNGSINTSDITLKTDIETTSLGLDFIDTLNPIEYKWADGGVRTHLGFSAQDIKQKLIDYKGDSQNYAMYTQGSYEVEGYTATDKEGNLMEEPSEGWELYGLRMTELIPVLVKSVQELKDRVEELEG